MKIQELVTHEGHFHADDVMAGAVLTTLFPNAKLIRSRNEEYIRPKPGRIVWDVGHTYEHGSSIYDHHQDEGAGKRDNGVPYASFGLVWENFGKQYLQFIGVDKKDVDQIWGQVDAHFVQPLDAHDTGYSKSLDSLDFTKVVSNRIPAQKYSLEKNEWKQSPDITESEYYSGFSDLLPYARKRLFDYVQFLVNKSKIKYDSKNLRLVSRFLISLAIKKLANPDFDISRHVSPQKIKKSSLGLLDINPAPLGDFVKSYADKIMKSLSVSPEYHNVVLRKFNRILLNEENLFNPSHTNLLSMMDQAVLSNISKHDDILKQACINAVEYAYFFFRNYITSSYSASTGHQMVKQQISGHFSSEGEHKNILVLPGGAEYTSVVNIHNKTHPNQLITTVIYPYMKSGEQTWNVKHVTKGYNTYETYKKFPLAARGKLGDDIATALGVPYMGQYVFCHNAGHLLVSKSFDAALAAAKLSEDAN